MNITNAKYRNGPIIIEGVAPEANIGVDCLIDGKHVVVPTDPANRHYAEIQKQVAAGTLTIADAD